MSCWGERLFTKMDGRKENLAGPVLAETHELLAVAYHLGEVVSGFLIGER